MKCPCPAECFDEAGVKIFDYMAFEQKLQQVLQEIGYPEDQVIRWEETPQLSGQTYDRNKTRPSYRAGKIEHYWHDVPGARSDNNGQVVDDRPPPKTFFVSRKLYMDTNHENGAPSLFQSTVNSFQLKKGPSHYPTAIIAGTFELDATTWMDRNGPECCWTIAGRSNGSCPA